MSLLGWLRRWRSREAAAAIAHAEQHRPPEEPDPDLAHAALRLRR